MKMLPITSNVLFTISTFVIAVPNWEAFLNGELKTRVTKENTRLGGDPEKKEEKEEKEEEEHEQPKQDMENKYSSHQIAPPEGSDEVEEDPNIPDDGDEDNFNQIKEKVNLLPGDDENIKDDNENEIKKEGPNVIDQIEVVEEEIINPGIDKIENEKLKQEEEQYTGNRKIDDYTSPEEKLAEMELTEVHKDVVKPEPIAVIVSEKKEEVKDVPVTQTVELKIAMSVIESPFIAEFATNNFWKSQTGEMKLEDLEKDYS